MSNEPQTPQGYGPPPFPPPPHAGYNQPPRKSNTKWIVIIIVLLVIALPVLGIFLLGAVAWFSIGASSETMQQEVSVPVARIEEEQPVPAQDVLQTEPWRCIRVIDGDTIEVQQGDKTERVRLLCIDTPERGKPGYDEATQALRQLIDGYLVNVVHDPQHDERDKFGRLLGYVIFSDHNDDGPLERIGMCVNVEMIKLGHTTYYTKYGESSLYHDEFRIAAEIADDSSSEG